jgi:polyadenylate-binding protein
VYKVESLELKRTEMPPSNPDEEFLRQYEVDRRSVFVGNLPEEVTENEVAALFEQVGEILSVQVVRKEKPHGKVNLCNKITCRKLTRIAGIRAFGFVEFARPDMPEQAVQKFVRR